MSSETSSDSPSIQSGTIQMDPIENTSPPSCFLSGTKIQVAWDATSLELLKRCPRLYQYVMIDGWQPQGEAIHLRFGIEYHQALHDYETFMAMEDMDHDNAVVATIHSLLVRMKDWDPNPRTPSEEKKSKKNLVRAVVWYLDKFKDDPAKTVEINGKPAMEVSFRFELDYEPNNIAREQSIDGGMYQPRPYLLCGHLDRVVNFQGAPFVMDRKTASSTISTYYFNQYHPHNQMSLYTLAGKVVLETPIRGVIIDAVNVNEEPSFERGVTYRTQDQIDEWLYDLQYYLHQAEAFAIEGYWPMNDTACDKYGGCKFRDICQKSPQVRERFLANEFKQLAPEERWNPLKPR